MIFGSNCSLDFYGELSTLTLVIALLPLKSPIFILRHFVFTMSQKICHEIMIFRRPFNQNQHTDQLVISANECMKRRMINITIFG